MSEEVGRRWPPAELNGGGHPRLPKPATTRTQAGQSHGADTRKMDTAEDTVAIAARCGPICKVSGANSQCILSGNALCLSVDNSGSNF